MTEPIRCNGAETITVRCVKCDGYGYTTDWAGDEPVKVGCNFCLGTAVCCQSPPRKSKLRGIVRARVSVCLDVPDRWDHPTIALVGPARYTGDERTLYTLTYQRHRLDTEQWSSDMPDPRLDVGNVAWSCSYAERISEACGDGFRGPATLRDAARIMAAIGKAARRLGGQRPCEMAKAIDALRLLGVAVEISYWDGREWCRGSDADSLPRGAGAAWVAEKRARDAAGATP